MIEVFQQRWVTSAGFTASFMSMSEGEGGLQGRNPGRLVALTFTLAPVIRHCLLLLVQPFSPQLLFYYIYIFYSI